MTYPSHSGERLAVLRPEAGHDSLNVGTTTARLVATGTLTQGNYGLFRWEMSGAAGGADPHYHTTFAEAFYSLSVRVQLYDGSGWTEGGPGDFLHVPRNGIHGFANESGEPASMLILFVPGPPREEYFRELGELIASGRQLSESERAAFLARHDQYSAPAG